jgi:hypothetical protein
MTILRTGAGLSSRDIRGLKRDRYVICGDAALG